MKLVSRLAEEDKAHGIVAMVGTQGTTLALERERDHAHTSCTLDKWYIGQLSPAPVIIGPDAEIAPSSY